MAWEVWKWLDTGEVEFRIHAFSQPAPITNPAVALGFRVIGQRERARFLGSTLLRMRAITEAALNEADGARAARGTSREVTAHHSGDGEPAHDRVADSLGR
jgi:hypothetical protein